MKKILQLNNNCLTTQFLIRISILFTFLLSSCGYLDIKVNKNSSLSSGSSAFQNPNPEENPNLPPPVTIPEPPAPVSAILNAFLTVGNQIDLAWFPSDSNSLVTYSVYRSKTTQLEYSSLPFCENISITTCIDSQVEAGVNYFYKIEINNGNEIVYSNEVNTIPMSPFNITALYINQNNGTLTWPSVPGATFYTIMYGSSSNDYSASMESTTSTMSFVNLPTNIRQYFKVIASNQKGSISSTNELNGVALGSFQITSITPGNASVTLEWNNSLGATSYQIEYGTTSGLYTDIVTNDVKSPYIVSGLKNGTTYYFRVQAKDQPVSSRYSDSEASATPTRFLNFLDNPL